MPPRWPRTSPATGWAAGCGSTRCLWPRRLWIPACSAASAFQRSRRGRKPRPSAGRRWAACSAGPRPSAPPTSARLGQPQAGPAQGPSRGEAGRLLQARRRGVSRACRLEQPARGRAGRSERRPGQHGASLGEGSTAARAPAARAEGTARVSHVEKRVQAGRVTYRARWRDPSGRERKRSFDRKTDAQRFLVGVEDSKLRGAYVDPARRQGRLRRVGRAVVRHHGRAAAGDPAHLPAAARPPDPPPLRRGALWRRSTPGRPRVAGRAGRAGPVSPSGIRNAAQVLGQVLDAAVAGGRLARNPAAGVRLPRVVEREMTFLSAGRARAARRPDRPTLRGAGALPRLDGPTDRGGGRAAGRAAGSARRPGRGGRGGDRGGRPARVGADQDRRAPHRAAAPVPGRAARRLPRRPAPRPRRAGVHHAPGRAAAGLQVGRR